MIPERKTLAESGPKWFAIVRQHLTSTEGQADRIASGWCVVRAKSGTMPEIEQ
jgi:hypothetical protein